VCVTNFGSGTASVTDKATNHQNKQWMATIAKDVFVIGMI